jgi:hypothetical protein
MQSTLPKDKSNLTLNAIVAAGLVITTFEAWLYQSEDFIFLPGFLPPCYY